MNAILSRIYRLLADGYKFLIGYLASLFGSASYWNVHMVRNRKFGSSEESLNHLKERNDLYPTYIELMPVSNYSGKVILDYGCGPGNDLVGFGTYSNPKKLIGADVSKKAINFSKQRLGLHKIDCEFLKLDENNNLLDLESNSIDLIHSSGVLHHCKDLDIILSEFFRVLKEDGKIQIMVYNYNSLWLHLYVAYLIQVKEGRYKNLDLEEAFRKSTDGANCPISRCYKPNDFIQIMNSKGFDGKLNGVSISKTELDLIEYIEEAKASSDLGEEHINFLRKISSNNGFPKIEDEIAGINACYIFKKRA